MKIRLSRSLLRPVVYAAAVALCGQLTLAAPASAQRPTQNMLELLEDSGRFTTLLSLLETAGLAETIAQGRPLTLLAPNDDAFAALDPALVDAVLADPEGLLRTVLLYHVLGGWKNLAELQRMTTAETVEGRPIIVRDLSRGERAGIQARRGARTPHVNDARVLRRNWRATNGIVHELAGVLVPPEEPAEVRSLVDVLVLDGRFATLLAAVEAAGLAGALSGDDDLTLFAPTDAAFEKLGAQTVESLLAEPGLATLTDVLLYHVAPEGRRLGDLLAEGAVETLQGSSVAVAARNRATFVGASRVVNSDLIAPNGVIQVIDAVLLP
jgi:uncharacterized surface protein with fasciclin (FAS1) repeats